MRGPFGTALQLWLAPLALAGTIVAFAAGSSSVTSITTFALDARWAALVALLLVGVALAAARAVRLRDLRAFTWLFLPPAGLVGLAALSTVWSITPGLTFARTGSLGILVVAAAGLGYSSAGDRAAVERLLAGVVLGVGIVALIGIGMLAVGSDAAVQGETSQTAWRYRGFGMNPNTVSMLCAVALPPATLLAFEARGRFARGLAGVAVLALYFTVIASESRGAMLASLVGMLVVASFVVPGALRKSGALTLIIVAFVGGNVLRASSTTLVPSPPREAILPDVNPITIDGGAGGKGGGGSEDGDSSPRLFPLFRGEVAVRPEDEIGHPLLGDTLSTTGSGRIAAWKGAINVIRDRPLLGYGFGTESKAFVDRWYFFQGANPENAFLGLLLQLGIAGLTLFAAIGLAVLAVAVRALSRTHELRGPIAALLGIVCAGAALMVAQSYIYSVGNVATVTVWVAGFALAGSSLHVIRAPARSRERARGAEVLRPVDGL